MFEKTKQFAIATAATLVGFAGVAGSAMADGVDVSAAKTAIDATLTPIGLLGGASLLVFVGIKTYKWVRRAM